VEPQSTAQVSNKEHGTRVPPVSDLFFTAVLVMSLPETPERAARPIGGPASLKWPQRGRLRPE